MFVILIFRAVVVPKRQKRLCSSKTYGQSERLRSFVGVKFNIFIQSLIEENRGPHSIVAINIFDEYIILAIIPFA